MNYSALLIGATGMIGSECLDLLLNDNDYREVIVFTRRKIDNDNPKLIQYVIDFDHINQFKEIMKADHVYCCLGTTQKKVKNKEEYEKIDRFYPVEIGKLALVNGANHFLLISAIGANTSSAIFYNKLKGLVEEDINKLGFNTVSILRPSILFGNRKEYRFGESASLQIMNIFSFLFIGPLKKYKPIHANTVAKAMIKIAKTKHLGITRYESDRIQELGQEV